MRVERSEASAFERTGWRESARAGATAWAAYALTECFLLTVPRLERDGMYPPLGVSVETSAVLLALYPATGALLASLLASLLDAVRSVAPERIAAPLAAVRMSTGTLSLTVAVGVAQSVEPAESLRLVLPTLGIATGLAALHFQLGYSRHWSDRLRFLLRPWAVALLLLVPPWAADRPFAPPALAALSALGAALGIAGFTQLARRRTPRPARPSSGAGGAARHRARALLYVAASGVLVLIGSRLEPVRRPAGWPAGGRATVGAAGRPNLVLVTLDTVRADHLSLYGYERRTTPGLERLATQATVYDRAIATGPITLESHASMFTGLYSNRTGTHYEERLCPIHCPLDERFVTLAEILSRRGYRTAGVAANFGFLGAHFGLGQGFDLYDARPRPSPPLGAVAGFTLRGSLVKGLAPRVRPELSESIFRNAGEINRSVFGLLEELAAGGQPFFLFVNYMDAHEPRRPPEPYDRRYPGKDDSFRYHDYVALERDVLSLKRPLSERERAHIVSQYDGAIAYLDDELGRLAGKLHALGLDDTTALVVTSDHGEAFGERGFVDHSSSTYQDQVHVPLVVKLPGQRVGRRVADSVSVADLFPTLLELAGEEAPPGIDGVSLLEHPPEGRLVLSESFANRILEELHPRFRAVVRAAFRGPLKLHVSTSGAREAYDLDRDPGERNPLDAGGDAFRALDSLLADWLALHPAATRGAVESLDAETRERLRALGYL